MLILVFDTETNNLINKPALTHDEFYIVQLSWIVYNTKTTQKSENDIILKIPLPITNSHIHGITNSMSQLGYPFEEIIDIFMDDVQTSDLIVGHNLQYDLNALEIELDRYHLYDYIDMLYNKKHYDTMLSSVNLLKIPGKYGRYKYPKLCELYQHFYGCHFENQHNSLYDVRATLDCFVYLQSDRSYFKKIISTAGIPAFGKKVIEQVGDEIVQ